MTPLRSIAFAFAAIAFVCAPAISLAQVESTPVPAPQKPDFSSMNFLVGTWSCSNKSSRRPSAFPSTTTYALDSNGFWLNADTDRPAIAWAPMDVKSVDKITYDPIAKRWVDVGYDDAGNYTYSTSSGWSGANITWHDNTFVPSPDIASQSDAVTTKDSDTKTTTSSTFTEGSGRKVSFVITCTKK
jgi:hypothetical protein